METRLWNLYNLIKENSLKGLRTTQVEICEKIDGYEYKDRKGTTDKCSRIWNDVNEINQSSELEKLILTKNYEYWIGTEEETREYIDRYFESIAPALKRYWNMIKKIKLNGSYKFFSQQDQPIDENSKARRYVENFINPLYKTKAELESMQLYKLYDYQKELGGSVMYGTPKEEVIADIIRLIKEKGI